MPVKWTPEADQLLFLKVLETHNIQIDTRRVSEAWPTSDPSSVPTPLAIKRHMQSLKSRFQGKIGLTPGGPSSPSSSSSAAATAAAAAAAAAGIVSSSPLKKPVASPRIPRTPKRKAKGKSSLIGNDDDEEETDEDVVLRTPVTKREPSKRIRSAVKPALGMVLYDENDDDDDESENDKAGEKEKYYDIDDDDREWHKED
ncbi:hypothetical protein KEM54_000799 [Ascosphaera aggregata]|nr:hypothetical protein KEM54_000799 [Ascosphaera aggregata]